MRPRQNEKAKEKLDVLIAANTENAEINHLLGVTQFRLKANVEALSHLEKAVSLDAENEVYASGPPRPPPSLFARRSTTHPPAHPPARPAAAARGGAEGEGWAQSWTR
jgi:hypothetical protein